MEGGKDEQDSLLTREEKEEFHFQLEDQSKDEVAAEATKISKPEGNPFASVRQDEEVSKGVMEDPFLSPQDEFYKSSSVIPQQEIEHQQNNPSMNPTQSAAPPWSVGQVEADKRLEDIARRVSNSILSLYPLW